MPKKIASVIGATGTQGGAVISALQDDPHIRLRAITREPTSAKACQLSTRGVQVVQADFNDVDSLKAAFAGSAVIFGVTDFWEPFAASGGDAEAAREAEARGGINIAVAAAATEGLEHFIWSTSCDFGAVTNGRYRVGIVESKVAVDRYIRERLPELLEKTTFLVVGSYGKNILYPSVMPTLIPSADTYVQFGVHPPDTLIPTSGDVDKNLGKFILAILAQPDATRGTAVVADVEVMTAAEMLQAWARAKGVKAVYVQVNLETYDAMWPKWGDLIGTMMQCFSEAKGDWGQGFPEGTKVLRKGDLGVTGLKGLEAMMRSLDTAQG